MLQECLAKACENVPRQLPRFQNSFPTFYKIIETASFELIQIREITSQLKTLSTFHMVKMEKKIYYLPKIRRIKSEIVNMTKISYFY